MSGKSIGAAALLALASVPAAAIEADDLYYQVRPSLVQLVGVGADGRRSLGSGVALPDGTVVTNCHVTLHATRVGPLRGNSSRGNLSLMAQSQRADVLHDLCTLRISGLNLPPAQIGSSRELRVGEKVYAVGFNGGRGLTYAMGEVAELFEFDGGMVIRTTAAFSHGASGGGLFDEQGRLVGILTFLRAAGEPAYFAVPVEWLEPVAQMPSGNIQPLDGVPFWSDSLERQPAFLQAGTLEGSGKWAELARLARAWTQADPDNGQAWLLLAKATLNIGDRASAEAAFRRAAGQGVSFPADPLPSEDSALP